MNFVTFTVAVLEQGSRRWRRYNFLLDDHSMGRSVSCVAVAAMPSVNVISTRTPIDFVTVLVPVTADSEPDKTTYQRGCGQVTRAVTPIAIVVIAPPFVVSITVAVRPAMIAVRLISVFFELMRLVAMVAVARLVAMPVVAAVVTHPDAYVGSICSHRRWNRCE